MRVEFQSFSTERLRQARARFAAQPNWAARAAALTFTIVVLLPIVLLVAVAFIAAMLVLMMLGLVNRVAGLLTGRAGGLWKGRDAQGRRNVKVLPREG